MDHRRFRTGHRGPTPPPPTPPLLTPPPPPLPPPYLSLLKDRNQASKRARPPTPVTPPPPKHGCWVWPLKLCQAASAPKLFGSWCYPLPPPHVSQRRERFTTFGILPSRLRCSSNHAMRKASFEPTSGFRPFNYALRLEPEALKFGVWGFWGLGFWGLGFGVWGSG